MPTGPGGSPQRGGEGEGVIGEFVIDEGCRWAGGDDEWEKMVFTG